MSLLEQFVSEYTVQVKTTTADGVGGVTVSWADGRKVKLALKFNSSAQTRKADKDGESVNYVLFGDKDCGLKFHDVVKRADGAIFRITSDAGELFTPSTSTLNLTAFNAERWKLT